MRILRHYSISERAFVMKEILRLHLSIRKRIDSLRSG